MSGCPIRLMSHDSHHSSIIAAWLTIHALCPIENGGPHSSSHFTHHTSHEWGPPFLITHPPPLMYLHHPASLSSFVTSHQSSVITHPDDIHPPSHHTTYITLYAPCMPAIPASHTTCHPYLHHTSRYITHQYITVHHVSTITHHTTSLINHDTTSAISITHHTTSTSTITHHITSLITHLK